MSSKPESESHRWVIRAPTPVVFLIVAIILASVIVLLAPAATGWRYKFGLLTTEFRDGPTAFASSGYRLLTYAFVHGGIAHLLMNSVFLFCFGAPVVIWLRQRMQNQAGLAFLALFFSASIVGGAASAWLLRDSPLLIVGASTGVFGVFGALVRIGLEAPEDKDWRMQPLLGLFAMPVIAATACVVGLNLLQADFWPAPMRRFLSFGGSMRILWQAHILGYLFGLLSFPLFCRTAAKR